MREAFHRELELLVERVADMGAAVQTAMAQATSALLGANGDLIAHVIAGDLEIDEMRTALDDHAVQLLARQQPVATDLRTIVASLRIGNDLQRMGRLARHVAELARSCYPESALPAALHPTIQRMSRAAQDIVSTAREAIITTDATAAFELDRADDEMDRLHYGLYHELLDGNWQYGTAAAVRAALIARYFERYSDHAVSVARQVAFLAGKSGLEASPEVAPSS